MVILDEHLIIGHVIVGTVGCYMVQITADFKGTGGRGKDSADESVIYSDDFLSGIIVDYAVIKSTFSGIGFSCFCLIDARKLDFGIEFTICIFDGG